jgi:hypothetical protein
MTSSRRLVPCLTACALVLAGGCTLANWPYDLQDDTPVLSVDKPDSFKKSEFGALVMPIHKPLGPEDPRGTYVAVAAPAPSPTSIHRLARGEEILGGKMVRLYASAIRAEPWSKYDTGTAMASVSEWVYLDESEPDLGCLVLGEPGFEGMSTAAGGFTRLCLETTDTENPRRVEGSGLRTQDAVVPSAVGRSVATLTLPGSDELKYIVLGAEGSVHLLNNRLNMGLAPSLEPTDEADDYGVAVAAGHLGDDWPAWVAVGSLGRVHLYVVWDDPVTAPPDFPDGPDPDDWWLQASWESAERVGFGTRLWSGDVDDDGLTDLVVGTDPGIQDRAEDVVIVLGSSIESLLPAAIPPPVHPTVVPQSVPEDVVVGCVDFDERDVSCGQPSRFGSSVAVGDLDADGDSELVVGAPGAKVGTRNSAGAVYVFDPDAPAVPLAVLRDAMPEGGAHLGESVGVAHVTDRDEVVAGAPGTSELFVFFCSGVGDDNPNDADGALCR